MSGTIVINKGHRNEWVRASVDGVKGEKIRDAFSAAVRAEPGARELRVSFGGFRTNTVKVDVEDGVRHQVSVVPTSLEGLVRLPLVGILGLLLLAAVPGSVYRLKVASA